MATDNNAHRQIMATILKLAVETEFARGDDGQVILQVKIPVEFDTVLLLRNIRKQEGAGSDILVDVAGSFAIISILNPAKYAHKFTPKMAIFQTTCLNGARLKGVKNAPVTIVTLFDNQPFLLQGSIENIAKEITNFKEHSLMGAVLYSNDCRLSEFRDFSGKQFFFSERKILVDFCVGTLEEEHAMVRVKLLDGDPIEFHDLPTFYLWYYYLATYNTTLLPPNQ